MRNIGVLIIAILAAALFGCSDNSTAPDQAPQKVVADTVAIPEAATALLDSNIVTDMSAITDGNWPWEEGTPYEMARNCDVYAVTFVWGSFGLATVMADWSGSVNVNAVGAVYVHRTIDFEDGEDYLLPQTANTPTTVAWVSYTSVDADGVSLLVFVRNDVQYFAAPWLTFDSEPIHLEYSLDKLASLKEFHLLDGGLGLAVLARRIWPGRCSGGFMEGRWFQEDSTYTSGRLDGLWLGYRGDTLGWINAQYYTTDDGQRLLDGWVSGYITDQIIASIKGRWWYDGLSMCPAPWCGTEHGWFGGTFVFEDGSGHGGFFKAEIGNYMNTATDAASRPFRGVWFARCPWSSEINDAEVTNDAP